MWNQKIKELELKGLRQKEIASAIGVTQGTVSHIKTGRTKDIRSVVSAKLLALHKREMKKGRG